MSCSHNDTLLEKYYEEYLEQTLKEFKDVGKAEEKAERLARQKLEDSSV